MPLRVFTILLTILTILASGWPVGAAVHPGAKVIGLTTLPNTQGDFELVNQAPGPVRLYLAVYGYDDPQGIVAWDCALHLPRGMVLDHVELAGGGQNHHLQAGNFRVETREPLRPVDGIVLLATLDFRVLTTEEMGIDVGPDPLWGDSGFMGFARETYETLREPMHHPRPCPDCPVFMLTHSQADTQLSWPHIKALYRP